MVAKSDYLGGNKWLEIGPWLSSPKCKNCNVIQKCIMDTCLNTKGLPEVGTKHFDEFHTLTNGIIPWKL